MVPRLNLHPRMRTAVTFFLVEYETNDPVGLLLAWLCFAPPFLVAMQTTVFVTLWLSARGGRSVHLAGWLLAGQLTNEALNLVLKNVIRQERPDSTRCATGVRVCFLPTL